jgi:serine phosphatase RsbU (regulator of sigma subunit)
VGQVDASFVEVKANKQPIGKYGLETPFTNHSIQLEKGDTIYIFSDGYPDQFGGERGKKYKSGNFKKTLVRISTETIEKQKQMLDQEFESWRGSLEQIDDVCVIGVRV